MSIFYFENSCFENNVNYSWHHELKNQLIRDNNLRAKELFIDYIESPAIQRYGSLKGDYLLDKSGHILINNDKLVTKINIEPYHSANGIWLDKYINSFDNRKIEYIYNNLAKDNIITSPIILTDVNYKNYFHWNFDLLAKIPVLDKYKNCKILCLPEVLHNENYISMLQYFINIERLHPINQLMWVRDPVLAFTSLSASSIYSLRNAFPAIKSGKRRIYIHRRDRNIRNFDDFNNLLKLYNFETIDFSGMSFKEQLNAIEEAGIIVGSHGANLTNISYIRGHISLIELFPKNHICPEYFFINTTLKNSYHPYVSSELSENGLFHVSIDEINEILKNAIINFTNY